jgi:hypothetical protein
VSNSKSGISIIKRSGIGLPPALKRINTAPAV